MKLFKFIAGFFREDAQESMTRLNSLIFALTSVCFGLLSFRHANYHPEFNRTIVLLVSLSILFAVIAVLGKNIQKIIEKLVGKIKGKKNDG